MDSNGDGKLSKQEMMDGYREVFGEVSDEEINEIYRKGLTFRYVNDIAELMEFALLKEKAAKPLIQA